MMRVKLDDSRSVGNLKIGLPVRIEVRARIGVAVYTVQVRIQPLKRAKHLVE